MATYRLYIRAAVWLSALFYVIQGDIDTGFYFSSGRLGCERVVSQHPCPATILSPDLAIDYETDADMVNITLEEIKANNASQECISAITRTYCSILTPRCFVNGSKDFGDARPVCATANNTCPLDTVEEGLCESLKVGLQPLTACVKPSKSINGSCPQPKFKMPEEKLDLYIRSSIEYENIGYFENLTTARFPNGSRMFSAECVSKITELYCLPFYCSANEQEIVVEYTYEECEDIMYTCFNTAIDELYEGPLKEATLELQDKYIDNCGFYPDAIEPTVFGSGSPPANVTTPAFQIVSTTPPGENVSTTTQKEIPSTTPLQNATSTTLPQNIPTILWQNISTTNRQNIPTTPRHNISTTNQQNISTTPGQNISTTPPEMRTSEPEDPEPFTPIKKTEVLFRIPYPTAGIQRSFPSLLLLLFLLVLVHINM